ncbi:MAG: carbohydrate kinase family protein [Clostridiales bacterium]|nr:carbohydrate kinase family protein [Clostridiales bacterium]
MAEQYKINHAELAERLAVPDGRVLLGMDGFIDEVWQIIKSRAGNDEYVLYEKMSDFSQTLASCDEGGFSNEIVRKRRSYGGFTANTGKAVSRMGVTTTMLGRFGKNRIDSVFAEFAESSKLMSVGEPGLCPIYEFTDGKLMLPYIQEVMSFDWRALTDVVDEGELKALFAEADIIALGYWSLMPSFDEIVGEACRLLKDDPKPRRMFFDFADIRKRDRASLEATLKQLSERGRQIPMTLSLNEHEAAILFSYYGVSIVEEAEGAAEQTEKIRAIIGLDELVVHTPYFAASASASEGACAVPQDYCTSPIITTGAGDNFNGGYISALLKGLPMAERLAVANAVTYLYVSKGASPEKADVLEKLAAADTLTVYS